MYFYVPLSQKCLKGQEKNTSNSTHNKMMYSNTLQYVLPTDNSVTNCMFKHRQV